MPLYP